MSGPKTIRAKVTNAQLQQIFQLQSSLSILWDELSCLSINDQERQIFASCQQFLKSQNLLKKLIIKNLNSLKSLRYADEFANQLSQCSTQYTDLIAKLEEKKENFHHKKEDYQGFLAQETFQEDLRESFQRYKKQVIDYLQKYLSEEHPQLLQDAVEQIEAIQPRFEQAPFQWGYHNLIEQKRQDAMNRMQHSQNAVNTVRTQLSQQVPNEAHDSTSLSSQERVDKSLQPKIQKITQFIAEVSDLEAQQTYQEQLEALLSSETRKNDDYFYSELLEEITQTEKTRHMKKSLQELLTELTTLSVHQTCVEKQRFLQQLCRDLLKRSKIKPYQLKDLPSEVDQLKEQSAEKFREELAEQREELAKQNERRFIKEQLVASLQQLDYDVMDDMQVIDFEKDFEFFLKIPNQSNYMHLGFMEDGTFKYRFLIPEFKDDLSIEQIQSKLRDMDTACRTFKRNLEHLANIGIELTIEKELPISEERLIQVPQKFRDRIHTRRKDERRRQHVKAEKLYNRS